MSKRRKAPINSGKDVKKLSSDDIEQALEFIRDRLRVLEPLAASEPNSDEWTKWRRTTGSGLKLFFGEDSEEYKWFYPPPRASVVFASETREHRVARERKEYDQWVRESQTALQSVLDKYEALGQSIASVGISADRGAKAFISHGGKRERSLRMVEDFLRAMGVDPIVAERQASESREVHENVDHYRKLSDFAVVLWTRDIQDANGNWHPSGSVEVESGELREQFRNRLIYLKEEGVILPAMSGTIVFESFTEDNFAPALQKIVTELHAWGWLTVAAPD